MERSNFKVFGLFFFICVAMAMIAEYFPVKLTSNFYRYDRQSFFWPAFYLCLFCFGIFFHRAANLSWKKVIWAGLSCGIVSGIAAQIFILATNEMALSLDKIGILFGSLVIGVFVLLTPVWGLLSFIVWKVMLATVHGRTAK